VKPEALLRRISGGAVKNVAFSDLRRLLEAMGFALSRTSGSHHIFNHPKINELINIQEIDGEAKPYQVRQFLRMVERYNLKLELRP
jgi:virulence-associated protein VapD